MALTRNEIQRRSNARHRDARNAYIRQWCRENPESRRQTHFRQRFGISLEDYDAMLVEQDGKCAICRSAEPGRKGSKYFCVDHDHETGQVRGLLCHPCNTMLGLAKDNVDTLVAATRYLEVRDGQ